MKFHIASIRPPGFIHTSGFAELIDSLSWALSALGHDVTEGENTFLPEGTNILFGAELLPDTSIVPPNTILYNLEQNSHPAFNSILALGKKVMAVWDYAAVNLPLWKHVGINAVHVDFGFTPNLIRIPKAPSQPIDVFFSGWITPRRKKIIDELGAQGLKVVAVDYTYGGARDQLISRSKVCLNINHDGRTYTNIQRMSFWMANSKAIISERSSDMQDHADLEGGISFWDYDFLVQACGFAVKDWALRSAMEVAAYNTFSKRDYVHSVSLGLELSPKPDPIRERYEKGCREGDMKEHLPWLRKNVHGHCLEIGVRDGASTSALILGAEENDAFVTSVDISGSCDLFSHDRWTFYKADSKSLTYHDNVFDCAFIDGDHSEVGFRADLHNCYQWVKSGGWIACHDVTAQRTFEQYGGDYPSVAVGEEFKKFCKEKGLTNFYLPGVNGMGVLVVKK